jgi:hypothetical protein
MSNLSVKVRESDVKVLTGTAYYVLLTHSTKFNKKSFRPCRVCSLQYRYCTFIYYNKNHGSETKQTSPPSYHSLSSLDGIVMWHDKRRWSGGNHNQAAAPTTTADGSVSIRILDTTSPRMMCPRTSELTNRNTRNRRECIVCKITY